jgi:DNA (cytosine-5)-methyltransferase 1
MGMVKSNTPLADKNLWRTPPEVFAMLNKQYGPFTLDAAANEENHLCEYWYGPGSFIGEDALACSWSDGRRLGPNPRVFCNPPYNKTAEFIKKAHDEAVAGNIRSATLLVPATTDVKWFHEYVWRNPYAVLDFSKGRIRFLRPDGSRAKVPTHGSMFVTFYSHGGQLSLPGVGR